MCKYEYINKTKVLLDGYEETFKEEDKAKNIQMMYRKYTLASEIALNFAMSYLTNNKDYKYIAVGIKRVLSQNTDELRCVMLLVLFNNINFAKRLKNRGFKILKQEKKL